MNLARSLAAVLVAITTTACASADPTMASEHPRTAFVFGTVGQSEWCPAGNVKVDLATGEYAFTARASRSVCQNLGLERPVVEGRLAAAQISALNQSFERVGEQGLNACQGGRRPTDVIISNGGLHVLVVTNGQATDSAPSDLSCWTEAAWELHGLLDATFPSSR